MSLLPVPAPTTKPRPRRYGTSSIQVSVGVEAAGLWKPWLGPTSLLGGVLAMTTCTFLAGVLLAAEAQKLDDEQLAEELRTKSIVGGLITGLVVLAGIPVLLTNGDVLVDGLLGRGLPFVLVSAVAGTWTMRLLWQRRLHAARVTAATAVATVVAGWGAAQYPWILVDEATIEQAAGARPTLIGLIIAAGLAAVLVVPPLVYLFTLADSNRVGVTHPTTPQ